MGETTPPKRFRAATKPKPPMAYGERVVSEEVARVEAAEPGERHATLLSAAKNLGRFVAGGSLDRADVVDMLTEAADGNGMVDVAGSAEVERVIQDGLGYGADDPKEFPESLDPQEEDDEQSPLDKLNAALLDRAGLIAVEPPAPLVDGWLYRNTIATIYGAPSAGKSFVALDIAAHVSLGKEWHGQDVERGNVLYLSAEGSSGMGPRLLAWEHEHGAEVHGVAWLPLPVQVDSPEWDALIELARRLRVKLIVVDTQARVTLGMDENSARDMGILVHSMDRLKRGTGACVLNVHHAGKGSGYRGSSALLGGFDTYLSAEKEDDIVTLRAEKQKDVAEPDDLKLVMASVRGSVVLRAIDPTDVPAVDLESATVQRMIDAWRSRMGTDEVTLSELKAADVVTDEGLFIRVRHAMASARMLSVTGSGGHSRYRLLSEDRWR